MNKALLPLMEEDSNFEDVLPSLFGLEFAQKSKEVVDQVKAMQSTITTPKQFFDQAPQQPGGYTHKQGQGAQTFQKGNRQTQGRMPQKSWNK